MTGPDTITINADIKARNRKRIYELLFSSPSLTKPELAAQLSLSLPTVHANLSALLKDGLVRESGYRENTGGRNARDYSIVKDARAAVGLDITMHHVTAVVVNVAGEIVDMIRLRRNFEFSDLYMQRLGLLVDQLIVQAGIPRNRILGVGLGVPGLVTEDCTRIFYGKILDFEGASVEDFSKYIDFHCALFNDAKAAGFAEFWRQTELQDAFYIMLSSNVGGAVYKGGGIFSGRNRCAGEVGHIKVDKHGPRCYCGQYGCLDCYCAATVLASKYDGNLEAFFRDLNGGGAEAKLVWDDYLDHLARAVSTVRLLFDCPIIIGGYVGQYLDSWMDDLRKRIRALDSFNTPLEDVRTCRFKKESIAAGAALYFINKFLESI